MSRSETRATAPHPTAKDESARRRRKTIPHKNVASIPEQKPTVAKSLCRSGPEDTGMQPGSQANTPAPIRPMP
jgi:hypothetical protein